MMLILSANKAVGVCIALLVSKKKKKTKSEDHWHGTYVYMGLRWKMGMACH